MKFSESWLREWVNPNLSREELCNHLTMAGFEVEETVPVAHEFKGVRVGQVLKLHPHPDADQLQQCEVNVGNQQLSIVCGAKNVKAGMKVAVATLGASLVNKKITETTIRNVLSEGMLCSAEELGLTTDSEGLLELPEDAPIGVDLWQYLNLTDSIIDVAITPNRGDCLSVRGMAREVSALTTSQLHELKIPDLTGSINEKLSISLEAEAVCPRYVGRVIRNVTVDKLTPIWLKERLRRSGIRSINPVVDVTNYVMLELGQPMHAFDLNQIKDSILVRKSRKGERILLLDGNEKELDSETLLIADKENPLAIAGVMGGMHSSVTLSTKHIFLESAYFSPHVVARQRQYYQLNSDSAYRFERGIDPTMQVDAINRATQLILEIAGGEAGPIISESREAYLPKQITIHLPKRKITKVLGIEIPQKEVESILSRLNLKWEWLAVNDEFVVHVPNYRFDLSIAEDLIEEIARLYGYNNIPATTLKANLKPDHVLPDQFRRLMRIRQALSDQGYHEIVSYSFVSPKLQKLLNPEVTPREILNPISADMSVMRTNLWPGLINTLIYNKSRQQHRIRLFEIGNCFVNESGLTHEEARLAGLITGSVYKEQWGKTKQNVDFYDLKGDIENVLGLHAQDKRVRFEPGTHPALHPGRTAIIYDDQKRIGILGELHPLILQALDLTDPIYVFELDLNGGHEQALKQLQEISKFPEIRRDLAILVNRTVPAKAIQDTIKGVAGDWLKDVFIFDVYHGKGISPDLKSIALALILQHPSRTLVDEEVSECMQRVVSALKVQLGAELRS